MCGSSPKPRPTLATSSTSLAKSNLLEPSSLDMYQVLFCEDGPQVHLTVTTCTNHVLDAVVLTYPQYQIKTVMAKSPSGAAELGPNDAVDVGGSFRRSKMATTSSASLVASMSEMRTRGVGSPSPPSIAAGTSGCPNRPAGAAAFSAIVN